MKAYLKIFIWSVTVLTMGSCKQEYPLPEDTQNLNLLVVEGLLNSGTGPTLVRLSRSFNPGGNPTPKPELRAQVTVEGENNTVSVLTGNTKGEYISNQLNLNTNQRYRLRIKTIDGKEYLSDFVPVQSPPAIDSVHWQRTDESILFMVDTHDPQNSTRYYRWEYDETWEINSYFNSLYEYRNDSVVDRLNPSAIYYCWKYGFSNSIILGSSAKLSQDVISQQHLLNIPLGDEKITVRYSLLVRQFALTKEAYQFWEIMKKNTEQVGTLFDPQPSQLLSNIHCVNDPEEPVIGFVSAGSYVEKRLFITRAQVHPWPYYLLCEEKRVPLDSLKYYFAGNTYIPLYELYSMITGRLIGYVSGSRFCTDCTSRGSNVKPSYW
jgi:Domain of unknown function (DUF4249)